LEGHREESLMPKPYTQKPPTKEDSETLIFASWREVTEGYYFSNKKPTEGFITLHQMLWLDPQNFFERVS
jgi:hypothetical protein